MNPKTEKILLITGIFFLILALGSSAGYFFWSKINEPQQIVGGVKDEHGCIGSAGYTWCEIKNKCLRTWEEPCSEEIATDDYGQIIIEKINYPEEFKGLFLKLHIENDKISLLSKPEIAINGYPNYLPGSYKFMVKIISSDNSVLGEYGFNDPRIIQAEQGYQGPTLLDKIDFEIIVPYFKNTEKINIYSSTGLMLSTNID